MLPNLVSNSYSAIFTQEAPLARKWFSGRSCIRSNWNLETLIFEEWRKPENPENPKEPTTNLTHPWPPVLNRTLGPRRREVTAITTRPSLLPVNIYDSYPSSKLFEIPPVISSKVFQEESSYHGLNDIWDVIRVANLKALICIPPRYLRDCTLPQDESVPLLYMYKTYGLPRFIQR